MNAPICPACPIEAEGQPEQLGHRCGRLDRLGGDEVRPRTPRTTAMLAPDGAAIACLICRGTDISACGVCTDPRCWDWIRTYRYPHHARPRPAFLASYGREALEEEYGLTLHELRMEAL